MPVDLFGCSEFSNILKYASQIYFAFIFWTFYFELLSSGQSGLIVARETNWNSTELTFLPYSNMILLRDIIFGEYIYMIILVHVDKFPKRAVEEGWYSTASSLNDLYRIPALPQFFFILVVVKVGKGIACHTVDLSSDLWSNDHNIVFLS